MGSPGEAWQSAQKKKRARDSVEDGIVLRKTEPVDAGFIGRAGKLLNGREVFGASGGERNAGTQRAEFSGKALSDASEAGEQYIGVLQGDRHRLQRQKDGAFGSDGGVGKRESGILQHVIVRRVCSLQKRAERAESAAEDNGVWG